MALPTANPRCPNTLQPRKLTGGVQGSRVDGHTGRALAAAPRTFDGVLGCIFKRLDNVHTAVGEELATHAQVHHGKTQDWNRGGVEPSGVEEIARAVRVVKSDAVVWRGDPLLSKSQKGVRSSEFQSATRSTCGSSRRKRQQEVLFQRLPFVNDTKTNFWLRAVSADSLRMMKQRHTSYNWRPTNMLIVSCRQRQLTDAGLVIPPWEELANTQQNRVNWRWFGNNELR